jgi:hypothetical protein
MGGGGGTVSDATTASKGVVQLAGDLAGTAASPALANSGVTAGSAGPVSNAEPGVGLTFDVPYLTVNAKGLVTTLNNRTVKMPSGGEGGLSGATNAGNVDMNTLTSTGFYRVAGGSQSANNYPTNNATAWNLAVFAGGANSVIQMANYYGSSGSNTIWVRSAYSSSSTAGSGTLTWGNWIELGGSGSISLPLALADGGTAGNMSAMGSTAWQYLKDYRPIVIGGGRLGSITPYAFWRLLIDTDAPTPNALVKGSGELFNPPSSGSIGVLGVSGNTPTLQWVTNNSSLNPIRILGRITDGMAWVEPKWKTKTTSSPLVSNNANITLKAELIRWSYSTTNRSLSIDAGNYEEGETLHVRIHNSGNVTGATIISYVGGNQSTLPLPSNIAKYMVLLLKAETHLEISSWWPADF